MRYDAMQCNVMRCDAMRCALTSSILSIIRITASRPRPRPCLSPTTAVRWCPPPVSPCTTRTRRNKPASSNSIGSSQFNCDAGKHTVLDCAGRMQKKTQHHTDTRYIKSSPYGGFGALGSSTGRGRVRGRPRLRGTNDAGTPLISCCLDMTRKSSEMMYSPAYLNTIRSVHPPTLFDSGTLRSMSNAIVRTKSYVPRLAHSNHSAKHSALK